MWCAVALPRWPLPTCGATSRRNMGAAMVTSSHSLLLHVTVLVRRSAPASSELSPKPGKWRQVVSVAIVSVAMVSVRRAAHAQSLASQAARVAAHAAVSLRRGEGGRSQEGALNTLPKPLPCSMCASTVSPWATRSWPAIVGVRAAAECVRQSAAACIGGCNHVRTQAATTCIRVGTTRAHRI